MAIIVAKFQAEGRSISAKAIRHLHSSGNLATVSRLLNEWRSRQSPAQPQASAETTDSLVLPDDLRQALQRFIGAEVVHAHRRLLRELTQAQTSTNSLTAENVRLTSVLTTTRQISPPHGPKPKAHASGLPF